MEEDSDFFSVKVLKVTHKDLEETRSDDPNPQKTDDLNLIQEFPNMISAKVIKVSKLCISTNFIYKHTVA